MPYNQDSRTQYLTSSVESDHYIVCLTEAASACQIMSSVHKHVCGLYLQFFESETRCHT